MTTNLQPAPPAASEQLAAVAPGDAQTEVMPAVDHDRAAQVPQAHFHAAGSGGVPGECSAICACGLTYAGFDTIAEAVVLLDRHIADPDGTTAVDLGDLRDVDLAGQRIAAVDAAAAAPTECVDDVTRHDLWPDGYRPPAAGTTGESAATPEPVRVPVAQLDRGMFVATGDPAAPGLEVRHVEPADDGADPVVGVVFVGPAYAEYRSTTLVELVDQAVVNEAAVRARARAHRAQQIEALRQLADLAERDDSIPMPRFTLRVGGGVDSPAAVRRFAAALDVPVTEDGYGTRAVWSYGGNEYTPAVQMEVSAAHKPSSTGKAAAAPAQPGCDR